MANFPTIGRPSRSVVALTLFAAACICCGVLTRFAGLGKWPLAIDEYYFAQSVQNILHYGIPSYACGGFYTRGLLLQYLAALLQLTGASPELAPRLIAALSSLIALPAVFILGRRVGGTSVGLVAVALMALSVWEVEVARLGRMYAPFQALFVWYLVCFLSYVVDCQRKALAMMLALSVVGVLVWEGGVLLALVNMLPPLIKNPSGRLRRRDWLYLAGTALLFVLVYRFATADLRSLGAEPTLPADYSDIGLSSKSPLDAGVAPWATLHLHPLWMLAGILPLIASAFAAYQIVRLRVRPSALIGLVGALACALLQQFELAADIVLIMLLLSMLEWRELTVRELRPFFAAILVSAAFWAAFALSTQDWLSQTLSPGRVGLLLGYEFVRFPDLVREVAIPWGRTDPILATALLVLLVAASVRAIARPAAVAPAERVLLVLMVCLVLAAAASHPPRHETRYIFFLYPLAIIIALTMVTSATRAIGVRSAYASLFAVLLGIGGFALTEDFQPQHLLDIDSAAVNFRVGLNQWQIAHYHPRSDIRGAAQWLSSNAHIGDVIISSFPGLDFYYPSERFFFMERTDPRYEAWACRAGTVERWGNRPLISSLQDLIAHVPVNHTAWLLIEPYRAAALAKRLALTAPSVHMEGQWTTPGGDLTILALRRP
jgi:hypothetical protein